MAMNELPLNGVFVERTVNDCSRGYSDDVLNRRMLLLSFKYINGN